MVIQNEELICALNTNKKLVTFMILSKSLIAIIYIYIYIYYYYFFFKKSESDSLGVLT